MQGWAPLLNWVPPLLLLSQALLVTPARREMQAHHQRASTVRALAPMVAGGLDALRCPPIGAVGC